MNEYWRESGDQRIRLLEVLEIPYEDSKLEPGPFGRFIKTAELIEYRYWTFDIRDFEILDYEKSVDAEKLGPEWDQAIERHWKRTEVQLDKESREEQLINMGFDSF